MKIVLFIDGFPSMSQTFIVRKVKALAEQGAQILVVSFGRPEQPTHLNLVAGHENIKIEYIPTDEGNWVQRVLALFYIFAKAFCSSTSEKSRYWKATKRYGSLLNRVKPARKLFKLIGIRGDVYHFEFGGTAVDQIDFLREFARPCITSFRGSDISTYPSYKPDLAAKYQEVMRYSDRIHCTAIAIASKAAQFGDPQKIFINRPSTDAAYFKPQGTNSRDPNLIITAGRLKWVKGLTYSLLAVAQLAPRYPKLKYVIVGDGPAKEELMFYVSDLGIQEHVHFYGPASAEEIRDLLEKSSIYLLSSVSEGISNAVLEAMAMETPVIVTNAGGMAEAVTDGIEGFVVPRYNSLALAEKMALLLGDDELRKKMGLCGRERILRDFTIERQTEVFLNEYEVLIKLAGRSKA